MVQRKGGSRKGTRQLFKKNWRQKGKISMSRYLAEFSAGDKVNLAPEPAVQRSLFHARFSGKFGEVKQKRGSCYEVEIKDGNKTKMLVIHPVHLKKVTQ